jgi:hypothetical protein
VKEERERFSARQRLLLQRNLDKVTRLA